MDLAKMTALGLQGQSISREDALAVLRSNDDELMPLVAAASQVRRRFFGNRVKLNYLVNLKSGLCPEDCTYCSQRLGSSADVLKYSWASPDEIGRAVEAGLAGGAKRVCLVASGHGPSERDVNRVNGIVEGIKSAHPGTEICVCLGFVDDDKAQSLHDHGADAYNHNLNTAESHYGEVCTTHTYEQRRATLDALKAAGLSPCSGIITGMGETDEELVDVVFALREAGVRSVPVNFLLPFDGTPLAGHDELTPQRGLRVLAMVRLVHPDAEVRAGAGREEHLRTQQSLALQMVNSICLGDYLTSEGQSGAADLQLIADCGLVVEGSEGDAPREPATSVPIRRRGVGTDVLANA